MTTFYTLLTTVGAAKLANATALGQPFVMSQMGVGDANGSTPTPNPSQTKLINELRRAPLNTLDIDPQNTSAILAEQVIPETVGGWWIRELGLYDADGDLVAVGNCPPTYKPLLTEGSGRTQVIRMLIVVSNTAAVTLKVDPAIVLATRDYVENELKKHSKTGIAHTPAQVGLDKLENWAWSHSYTDPTGGASKYATGKAVADAYNALNSKVVSLNILPTNELKLNSINVFMAGGTKPLPVGANGDWFIVKVDHAVNLSIDECKITLAAGVIDAPKGSDSTIRIIQKERAFIFMKVGNSWRVS